MTLGAVMGEPGSPGHEPSQDPAAAPRARGPAARTGLSGATAVAAAPSGQARHRRHLTAGLLGAIAATIVSLIFVLSFVGALHNPGPRSVPIGSVGPPAQASVLRTALARQAPGAFTIRSYSTPAAARAGISTRAIDAALIPGTPVQHLLVASAVGQAVTNATVKIFALGAASAGARLVPVDVRPLHASDPEGLSQVFFVIALLTPSLLFGNLLVTRVSPDLNPLWQVALIAVYAAIVAAAATALADAGIGALTGAPWGLFGLGTLLAFASAVMAAAAARWAGGIGVAIVALLFFPIGVASSGTVLGPNMITPWYADVGKALPPGAALPAVQNIIYFNSNNILTPLLVLSAWALAGILAMAMAVLLRRRPPGQATQQPGDWASAAAAQPVGRHARVEA
jgi:hypothetical protein